LGYWRVIDYHLALFAFVLTVIGGVLCNQIRPRVLVKEVRGVNRYEEEAHLYVGL